MQHIESVTINWGRATIQEQIDVPGRPATETEPEVRPSVAHVERVLENVPTSLVVTLLDDDGGVRVTRKFQVGGRSNDMARPLVYVGGLGVPDEIRTIEDFCNWVGSVAKEQRL